MTADSTKDQNPLRFTKGGWDTRVELLVASYPEMPSHLVEKAENLLKELVDEKGLPQPAIFFTEDSLITLEWVTRKPTDSNEVKMSHVMSVEIDDEIGYSTFILDAYSADNEAVEIDVATHDDAIKIITGWDFTHPY